MYSLSSALNEAAGALNAANGAIAVTSNNVSNVNTPGYTRQVASLSASALVSASGSLDNGVTFNGYTSTRDRILQLTLDQKQSAASSLATQSSSWSQVDSGFSGTDTGVGAAFSTLFSSLSALSVSPSNQASRQAALSAANSLATAFHQASSVLDSATNSANQTVDDTVNQINELGSQLAALNAQVISPTATDSSAGSVQDQRDALTSQLSQLTGLSIVSTESGNTLALTNGTPLVIRDQSFALHAVRSTDGTVHVTDESGVDLTGTLSGGTLGGALQMRDQELPPLVAKLNALASQFATAINTAQTLGYDANGQTGAALFSVGPAGSEASTFAVLPTDPAAIALSSTGNAGSSGNLTNLLDVQASALPSGLTPGDTYTSLVQTVGTAAAQAASDLSITNTVVDHLTSLQSSQSGVSIDEETTNLLRYQQAYSAAAQVISTVNSLFSALMNMGVAG